MHFHKNIDIKRLSHIPQKRGLVALRKFIAIIVLLVPFILSCNADAKQKAKVKSRPDTPYEDVVGEYIRSLGSIYQIQIKSQKQEYDDATQTLINVIENSRILTFQLQESINALKAMKVSKKRFEKLVPSTIKIYEEKLKLIEEVISISKKLLKTPKAGEDYSVYTGRIPEITARLEYLDETLFKITPMLCYLLIDDKPDAEGHMSHLIISKEQRDNIVKSIDMYFGNGLKMEGEKTPYAVASAVLVKTFLVEKGFLCTDEWQQGRYVLETMPEGFTPPFEENTGKDK